MKESSNDPGVIAVFANGKRLINVDEFDTKEGWADVWVAPKIPINDQGDEPGENGSQPEFEYTKKRITGNIMAVRRVK